jgi:hypothetical protein
VISCPPEFSKLFGAPVFPPFSNKTPPKHPILWGTYFPPRIFDK